MKTLTAVLLPLLVLACHTEPEQEDLPEISQSGASLTQMCRDAVLLVEGETWAEEVPTGSTINISWCAGYVLGLKDTVGVISAKAGLFCVPSSATSWDLIQPIVDFAAQHPESHGLHRAALAMQAWTEAFPCSGESTIAQPRLLG